MNPETLFFIGWYCGMGTAVFCNLRYRDYEPLPTCIFNALFWPLGFLV